MWKIAGGLGVDSGAREGLSGAREGRGGNLVVLLNDEDEEEDDEEEGPPDYKDEGDDEIME